MRITGGRWVNAGAASDADTTFGAHLDLTGIVPGPAVIEVRHYGSDRRLVFDRVSVIVR